MGHCCYKRKAYYDAHTSNVVLILAVALMLLAIPWLFSREAVTVVEKKKTNWSAFVTPFLVLLILLLVSFMASPRTRRIYAVAKPTYCRCKHACYCYCY